MDFVAIDFETATHQRSSACAVGIITVENSQIVDRYYTLIQPPNNLYSWQTIRVHGIRPHQTENTGDFSDFFPEIIERLEGKTIVAHNEAFDRNVLRSTMAYYHLDYDDYSLGYRWKCTCRIYRAKGYKPAKLSHCCARKGIALNHHHALSDAEGCAQLYLQQFTP
jgi:DNA polymerase-3 subunit epsilon